MSLQLEDIFSVGEMAIILETFRVTMANPNARSLTGDNLDITSAELISLREKVDRVMEE